MVYTPGYPGFSCKQVGQLGDRLIYTSQDSRTNILTIFSAEDEDTNDDNDDMMKIMMAMMTTTMILTVMTKLDPVQR